MMQEQKSEVLDKLNELVREREALRVKVSRTYYREEVVKAKERGTKVVYYPATGAGVEMAYALDAIPVMPSDNYSIFTCVRKQQMKYLEEAERRGMSQDICSYDRVGAGLMWLHEGVFGPLPEPDAIIGFPSVCETHAKYWEIVSDYYKTPYFRLDLPVQFFEPLSKETIEWAGNQVRRAVEFLEETLKKKMDWDRLREIVKYSYLTLEDYWNNVIELRKVIPSPWTCQETNNDLFFMVCMSGRKEMREYFEKVKQEVKFRVEHKIGKVPNEKFRLIYTNVPLWFYMEIIDYFHRKGAVFALDNYPTTFWLGFLLDRLYKIGDYYEPNFDKPEEILAMRIVMMSASRSLRHRLAQYEVVAREWSLDGAVFFANRTCPAVTRAVHLEERLYKEHTGGLTMTFYGEHCDPRTFSEPQTKAKIDAFIEALERKKSKQN